MLLIINNIKNLFNLSKRNLSFIKDDFKFKQPILKNESSFLFDFKYIIYEILHL
jgi:hypothetical protein